MSDLITPEFIEAIKFRDDRFRVIDMGIETRASLADNRPLGVVMARLRQDMADAIREFATANCSDQLLIQGLQARVFRCIYALETFGMIMDNGLHAERSVTAEDTETRERY